MKLAFTICSNNYLSLARALGKSLLHHNPDYTFFIGLVDKLHPDLGAYYKDFEIIPCDEIGLTALNEMANRYSIAEFNTSVKPFYFTYFLNRFPDAQQVLFVDPDMLIYNKLTDLDQDHLSHEILLTPHILHPMKTDGKHPTEVSYLSTGTFNLGFLSLRRGVNTTAFLDWWSERLQFQCYFDFAKGLFVDQKWVNLVPVFFDSVKIIRNPAYNIAYWNIQERSIDMDKEGKPLVNGKYPLMIYHFSSVNIKQGKLFYKQQNRYTDEDFPVVKKLFLEYQAIVLSEGYLETNKIGCYYLTMHDTFVRNQLKGSIGGRIKLLLKAILSEPARQRLKKRLAGLISE